MRFDARPKLSIQRKFFARVGAGEEATAEIGIVRADGGRRRPQRHRRSAAAG